MSVASRQAEVRRPLMAVKPMTQQGQRVCFDPGRAFANKIHTARGIPSETTPDAWNYTVELEAPSDANRKLREVMDIMHTEQRFEQTQKVKRMSAPPLGIKQMMTVPQKTHLFGW